MLPGEPLIDGATGLRPWRDTDLQPSCAPVRTPRSSAGRAFRRPTARPTRARTCSSATTRCTPASTAPFAIVDDDDAQLLGSISLMRLAWQHARGEVGYWLARDARGQGHATRAVRLICRWGFRSPGARADRPAGGDREPGLAAVAERSGFTREAVLRSYMRGKGERQDMVAFGLLRDELQT